MAFLRRISGSTPAAVMACCCAVFCVACKQNEHSSASQTERSVPKLAKAIGSGPQEKGAPPAQVIDLLHHSEVLIVSSSHRDAKSRVEFLADELEESAWRPNPPDPAPWIELRFAREVRVESIVVVPAGEKDSSTKLELAIVGMKPPTQADERFEFAPSSHAPTKTVRIQVKNVASKKAGAGVELSELRVKGTLGNNPELAYALPEGRIQQKRAPFLLDDSLQSWWSKAPYSTASHDSTASQLCAPLPQDEKGEGSAPLHKDGLLCTPPKEPLKVEGTAPKHVLAARLFGFYFGDDVGGVSRSLLALQTSEGWTPANLWSGWASHYNLCPGFSESTVKLLRASWEGTTLVQERYRHFMRSYATSYDENEPPSTAARSQIRCATEGQFSCREYILAYGAPHITTSNYQPVPSEPKTWEWERTLLVGPSGWLRFSPCTSVTPNDPEKSGAREADGTAPDKPVVPAVNKPVAPGVNKELDKDASPKKRIVPCFAPHVSALP